MSQEHESVKKMWESYLASLGETTATTDKSYTAWHFCNNKHDADKLADLVIAGTKKATASLYALYEAENEPLPAVDDLSIITNFAGEAQCIIKTIDIQVVPYNEVTEEFAFTEGEGDKSLAYWKRVHWEYFSEECSKIGREPAEDMLVVCERFEVAFIQA